MIQVLLLAIAALPAAQIQRTPPSELAARAGQQVQWRDSLSGALEESKASGKPVFWYVTGTRGTFMDRKAEIDWMMMAGPFAWPRTVALLNERFIPVRGRAGQETGERYGLVRLDFIEPGWIVLDGDGAELARRDRINTVHPAWFAKPLADLVGADFEWQVPYPGTALDWRDQARLYARWVAGQRGDSPLGLYVAAATPEQRAEALYIHACALHDLRDEAGARLLWRRIAEVAPAHPLAAAGAMEAEGHGPWTRGLASFDVLPADVLTDSGAGSQAAAGALIETEIWAQATRFLQRMQRANGGWEDSIYDFGGTDSLPNVYVATSALVMQALLEAAERGVSDEARPLVDTLIAGHRYVVDDARLAPGDADELVWAYLYRAQFLARRLAQDLPEPVAARTRLDLAAACDALVAQQQQDGWWRHEYPNPFVTAQALVVLHQAQQLGIRPDGLDETVARGIDALRRARTDEIAYTYAVPRGAARAAVAASVGRAPLGELALQLWGAEDADLAGAIERSFRDEGPLFRARKYDNHTNLHSYGGFFFFYDLHVRTLAIAAIDDLQTRRQWAVKQKQQLLALAEFDGAFVDSHELGRSYGTAMALICLAELDRAIAPR